MLDIYLLMFNVFVTVVSANANFYVIFLWHSLPLIVLLSLSSVYIISLIVTFHISANRMCC